MKKLLKRIDQSLYDVRGKISHTRISSYIILIGIYISSIIFLLIDVVNAIITWRDGDIYEIPSSHIGIFALLLGHHLALLGIKKYGESKIKTTNSEYVERYNEEDIDENGVVDENEI